MAIHNSVCSYTERVSAKL